MESPQPYPASLTIDYPDRLARLSTLLRIIYVLPILAILSFITSVSSQRTMTQAGEQVSVHSGGVLGGLVVATALMLLFRRRYPRWWFDFVLELTRFTTRIGAYVFLLTDKYPSTVETQTVHLEVPYPDARRDLNRWLPLVKWIWALPHYLVLMFLTLVVAVTTVIAWFAILITARYPRGLFDFTVGVGRWMLRVNAYAFLLTTDRYPPFCLK